MSMPGARSGARLMVLERPYDVQPIMYQLLKLLASPVIHLPR